MTSGCLHWVLVETGANQAYIFDSNRFRHAVGASQLVYELGTSWVREAAGGLAGVRVVSAISGKALLLAEDPDVGRALVEQISARALREAPGLQVTGCVGPEFDPHLAWHGPTPAGTGPLTHVEALEKTYRLIEVVRADRPPAEIRDPMLPWFAVCTDTGLPTAGDGRHKDDGEAAAPVLVKSAKRDDGLERMRDLLADVPDVVPRDLAVFDRQGWIAVVHADGNGVGRVFTDFPQRALRVARDRGEAADGLTLEEHTGLLADFATELEAATTAAFGIAVRDVVGTVGPETARGSVLPVVVGGDDLSVVCRGDVALGLVQGFVLEFEGQTSRRPTISAIVTAGLSTTGSAAAPPRAGLTAAAGIAYVKPHHPFSAAYALAEELTTSAKRVTEVRGREVSAVDFHVAFEPTLGDLDGVRAPVRDGDMPRHGGPYILTRQDDPDVGPRDLAELERAGNVVRALSSSLAHELREGLGMGHSEYAVRLQRAARSPDLPAATRAEVLAVLAEVPAGPDTAGEPIARLLDAMLLQTVARTSKVEEVVS